MSGTTIIREPPRTQRGAGVGAAGFVLSVPPVRSIVEPAWHESRVALRAHAGLLLGLTLTGMLFWPLTLGGLALIAPLPATLAERMPSREEVTAWYALAGGCAGLVTGAAQWLVLRRTATGAIRWAPLTALGWAGGMIAAVLGTPEVVRWLRTTSDTARFSFWAPQWERYVLLAIVGLGAGLALGTAQWIALRGLGAPLRGRSVWIAATALAWSAGLAFVPVVPRSPDFVQRMGRYSGGFDSTLPALVLAGAFYGLLTGFALTLLLRRAIPQPVET